MSLLTADYLLGCLVNSGTVRGFGLSTSRRLIGFAFLAVFCLPPAGLAEQTGPPPATKPSTARAQVSRSATQSAKPRVTRRTRRARARAGAMAREMATTRLPRYKVDESGDLVPDLKAAAAIIYDPVTNEVLWEENSQLPRSIASITKVMTALVFLESPRDLGLVATVSRADVSRASTTVLRAGDVVTVDALLHLLLIASDNAAARVLARVSHHGAAGFIDRMNAKAVELGLTSTRYADPSGLLADNVSSAFDMARLITIASAEERIASIMRLSGDTVQVGTRDVTIRSTNHLIGRTTAEVRAGKTGFISRAGYCLATLLRLPETGRQFAVVVLGARSNAGRFLETQNLLSWLTGRTASALAVTGLPLQP
jgi:D-alanyl-D-alanine endopeptidase (penicillin-binding protein 7)